MDVAVEGQKRKVNWRRIFLVVGIIISAVFFIGPGIMGYGVYLQMKDTNYTVDELGKNIHSLQEQLQTAQQNLSLQNAFNDNVMQLIEKSNDELITCKTEKTKVEAESKFASELCDQRVQNLQQQINEDLAAQAERSKTDLEKAQADLKLAVDKTAAAQSQLLILQDEFNAFVENTARNICCKQKFDNLNINAYSIINNRLVCLENGGKPISCSLG